MKRLIARPSSHRVVRSGLHPSLVLALRPSSSTTSRTTCSSCGALLPALLLAKCPSCAGSDALKALALGAKAVCIGRPFIYGLALGGEEGVTHVLRSLLAEFDVTMALAGRKSIAELDRAMLEHVGAPPSLGFFGRLLAKLQKQGIMDHGLSIFDDAQCT